MEYARKEKTACRSLYRSLDKLYKSVVITFDNANAKTEKLRQDLTKALDQTCVLYKKSQIAWSHVIPESKNYSARFKAQKASDNYKLAQEFAFALRCEFKKAEYISEEARDVGIEIWLKLRPAEVRFKRACRHVDYLHSIGATDHFAKL